MFRSLRTQQRAYTDPPETNLSDTPKSMYWIRTSWFCINVNVPPMSATGKRVFPKWLGSGVPLYTDGTAVLLRKEVIQPHLPVRLPCYDLVLITDPTFDSSSPCGLGHWLRVLPTFMT